MRSARIPNVSSASFNISGVVSSVAWPVISDATPLSDSELTLGHLQGEARSECVDPRVIGHIGVR